MKKRSYAEDIKYFEAIAKHKYKCKCGHTVVVVNKKKTLCTWCGCYVYKDKKEEFKERLKGALC